MVLKKCKAFELRTLRDGGFCHPCVLFAAQEYVGSFFTLNLLGGRKLADHPKILYNLGENFLLEAVTTRRRSDHCDNGRSKTIKQNKTIESSKVLQSTSIYLTNRALL